MGILNLNDDILMYTCAYLSSHDALALALSCKQLCPVARAHVSRHIVLSVTSSLLGGWKYLVAPDRARNIRTLRVRMPKYGYGGKKRPTLWSQAITELIGVARGRLRPSAANVPCVQTQPSCPVTITNGLCIVSTLDVLLGINSLNPNL